MHNGMIMIASMSSNRIYCTSTTTPRLPVTQMSASGYVFLYCWNLLCTCSRILSYAIKKPACAWQFSHSGNPNGATAASSILWKIENQNTVPKCLKKPNKCGAVTRAFTTRQMLEAYQLVTLFLSVPAKAMTIASCSGSYPTNPEIWESSFLTREISVCG